MNYCSRCGAPVALEIPAGDSKQRSVCGACGTIHYVNPKIVVGCVPERDGRILLCKRAIEPRRGYWTVPAGFLELDETIAEGAARETFEEATAEVEIGPLFASVDVVQAGQLHLFFKARLKGGYAPGAESLEVELYEPDRIPWDDIAFRSVRFALEKYIEDGGADHGVHIHEIVFKRGRE